MALSPRRISRPQFTSAADGISWARHLSQRSFGTPRSSMVQEPNQPAMAMSDAADLVADYAWGWKQDANDPTTGAYYLVYDSAADNNLEPWRAYWIRAYADCDLIIPAPVAD